jgi:hypothetical protein
LKYFETRFLEEAEKFIAKLDRKTISKIFYTIDIAEKPLPEELLQKILRYRVAGNLENRK